MFSIYKIQKQKTKSTTLEAEGWLLFFLTLLETMKPNEKKNVTKWENNTKWSAVAVKSKKKKRLEENNANIVIWMFYAAIYLNWNTSKILCFREKI